MPDGRCLANGEKIGQHRRYGIFASARKRPLSIFSARIFDSSVERGIPSRAGLSSSLAAHEKAIVEDALRVSRGRVFGPSGAAARLGIPRSTLESKIRALKIDKRRFRTVAKIL